MLPGPAVDDDDDDEEEEGEGKNSCWDLAMGRTRVSDCLSRLLGRVVQCQRKECIRKTVMARRCCSDPSTVVGDSEKLLGSAG